MLEVLIGVDRLYLEWGSRTTVILRAEVLASFLVVIGESVAVFVASESTGG